jgi:hypothetical protein
MEAFRSYSDVPPRKFQQSANGRPKNGERSGETAEWAESYRRKSLARWKKGCKNAEKERRLMNLTKEQRQAVGKGESVTVTVDGTECVIIRKDVFERVKAVIPNDLPSLDEQRQLLRQTGEMAGWDDPDMDVYDNLKP